MANEIVELTDAQHRWLAKNNLSESVWHTLTTSIHPGASPGSIQMYWEYCRARQLDPLKKPAHIVPMYVTDSRSGKKEWRDVIMPGISEARITASRTGQYAGQEEPRFGPDDEFDFGGETIIAPRYCTVTVHRLCGEMKVGYSHTEFFEEAAQTTKNGQITSMWRKRKRGQLAKCAEAGALRKAFPEELGGQVTVEEAHQGPVDVTPEKSRHDEALALSREIQDNVVESTPEASGETADDRQDAPDSHNEAPDLAAEVLFRLGVAEQEGDAEALAEAIDLTRDIEDEKKREQLTKHADRIRAGIEA